MNIIREHSAFRTGWDLLVVVLILVSCVLVPAQVAFVHEVLPMVSMMLYGISLLLGIDMLLNVRTTFRHGGMEVTDPARIRSRYMRTMFPVDLVANLPFEFLLLGMGDTHVSNVSLVLLVRLLHLLRIVRLFVIFHRWVDKSWTNSGILRIVQFIVVVGLFLHWTACTWFFVAFLEGFPAQSWATVAGIVHADPVRQYIRSLYWAVATLTTVGYGDITPKSELEHLLSICVMLLGASLYAFIIGNIASLVSNLDAAKARFRRRLDSVHQHLRAARAPAELGEQVRNYYEYLWAEHRGMREKDMFEDLPEPLRLDVLRYVARDFLSKVPLFTYSSPVLRDVFLRALRAETYAPGGYIAREDEDSRGIFFISSGEADIVSQNGTLLHGNLVAGDYFGDLSLMLNEKRTASVRARSYCEVYVLHDADFLRIKDEYPEFMEVMKSMSTQQSEKISSLLIEGILL